MIFNTLYYWGTPAKLLHWAGALLILFLYFHGLIVVGEGGSLERTNDPQVFLHAATGVTLGLMMLGRYVWRLINKIPLLPAKTPEWEKMLACVAHVGLYVATLITIVAGWFLAGALQPAVDVKLFGCISIPTQAVFQDKASRDLLALMHEAAADALMVMAVLHVIAALWHHFIQRDSVLRRMWLRGQNRQRPRKGG